MKFQDFLENWHEKNNLQESQLTCGLFMELWKEKYPNRNLVKVASEFIETLRERLESEWESKWWNAFPKDCISYLFTEANLENNVVKEKIISHLKQPAKGVRQNIFLDLMNEIGRVSNITSGEELRVFLELFKEHINLYNERLSVLDRRYKKLLWTIWFYAFQMISATEEFAITRNFLKDMENEKGSNYLFSPSHAHYRIKPEETIFILIRAGLSYAGGAPDKKLKKN